VKRKGIAPVAVAPAVDFMGLLTPSAATLFKDDTCFPAGGPNNFFGSGPVLLKAVVFGVGLGAGLTAEVGIEDVFERAIRLLVVLTLAADEAADEVRLITVDWGMGTILCATTASSVFGGLIAARAFESLLLGVARYIFGASDRFRTVWKGSSLAGNRRQERGGRLAVPLTKFG
jgi:hypothetical protein